MPSGSYTDGTTNTVAPVINGTSLSRGSISSIQTTPLRRACSSATASATCCRSPGVSAAPAQRTRPASGGSCSAAASRWTTPFCRVIRPTNSA
jgi:hypothetical protein